MTIRSLTDQTVEGETAVKPVKPDNLQLGRKADIPTSPDEAKIDVVNAPCEHPFVTRFTCPEFTSLCPVTGQPDFATIVIDYSPRLKMIESKALKLYLFSFRNHKAFHEACVNEIGHELFDACNPHWMRVAGYFYPRGGIPIDVFFQRGVIPDGVWIPEPAVTPYRPRI